MPDKFPSESKTRQRGRDDVLVQRRKHKRQHQSGENEPELLRRHSISAEAARCGRTW